MNIERILVVCGSGMTESRYNMYGTYHICS